MNRVFVKCINSKTYKDICKGDIYLVVSETKDKWKIINKMNRHCLYPKALFEVETYFTFAGLKLLQEDIHKNAIDKGWYESERNEGELIALIHSELSEALEALRINAKSEKITGFLGVEEELADSIIRILDMAEYKGYDVIGAMLTKHQYNKTRPHKHGNKKF